MITMIPEKLKLNKFQHVAIPKNRDYFSRYGFVSSPASQYSGDDINKMSSNKIDDMVEGERVVQYDIEHQKELLNKEDNG